MPAAPEAPARAPQASVVIPTYHRPQMLRETVRSVLAQQLADGSGDFEVMVCLSDPSHPGDQREARRLAAGDPRVHVVEATRPGPGAARNAGMRAARATTIALIDDDCIAQPGWLAAGLAQIAAGHDLVQGRTWPLAPQSRYYHSIWIDRLSWLWESCNLFVRRSTVDAGGMFDEDWNPTRRVGSHYGEDTEWGWRLVRRAGARYAFAPEARVGHAVTPRDLLGFVRYKARLRYMPLLLHEVPDAARHFPKGRFLTQRHAVLVASLGAGATAAVAQAAGAPRLARLAGAVSLAGFFSPVRGAVPPLAKAAAVRATAEAVELGALAYGSLRYRRVLI
jgi:glycosyltransferase involved in cell wall biosynthesis